MDATKLCHRPGSPARALALACAPPRRRSPNRRRRSKPAMSTNSHCHQCPPTPMTIQIQDPPAFRFHCHCHGWHCRASPSTPPPRRPCGRARNPSRTNLEYLFLFNGNTPREFGRAPGGVRARDRGVGTAASVPGGVEDSLRSPQGAAARARGEHRRRRGEAGCGARGMRRRRKAARVEAWRTSG